MINWNTDEKLFKANNPQVYEIWRVTQQINFGLWNGEKLNRDFLLANWNEIKSNVDSELAKTIEFLLGSEKWQIKTGLPKDKNNSWRRYRKTRSLQNSI